jgi:hypothetical protein
VHALGVLIELGASGPPADGTHLGHRTDDFLGDAADAVGLGQADARLEDDAHQDRTLVEWWQEGARKV